MIDPIFWLVLSFLLVSVSLTAVLVVLVPAVRELSRAARSVEKLCDTLDRELPPTLESIRLTSTEIAQLTDDVNDSVQSAHRVAQQVDHGVTTAKVQAKRASIGTRSLFAGVSAAWVTLTRSPDSRPLTQSPKSKSTQSPPKSTQSPAPQSATSPTASDAPPPLTEEGTKPTSVPASDDHEAPV